MSEKKIKFVDGQTYDYEIYNRIDPYSDILKQKLEPFDFNNPPIAPRYLAVSLIETMVKYRGVGLAANQVGLPYRVFVMGAEKVGFACFNP
jgi:peptide deformylase